MAFQMPYMGNQDPSMLYSSLGGGSGLGQVAKGAGLGALKGIGAGPIGMAVGGTLGAIGSGIESVLAKQQADRLYEMQMRALQEQEKQNEIQNQMAERKLGMTGIDMLSGMRNDAWSKYKKQKFQSDLARIAGA